MATSRQRASHAARTRPDSLRLAVICWWGAIAVAVAESVVAVEHAASSHRLGSGVVTETAVHVMVFGLAALLVIALANGRAFARVGLTLVLSVVGVASIVVPAVVEIARGSAVVTALGADVSPVFPWLRATHVALVVAATAAMYRESTSRHLRERTRSDGEVKRSTSSRYRRS